MFNIEDVKDNSEPDAITEMEKDLALVLVASVKDRLIHELLVALSSKNFYGEAAEYLKDNNMEITDSALETYGQIILAEFKKNAEHLIFYNEDTHSIDIHQSVMDFEFGSYYKPLLKLITKSLELILKDSLA